MGDLRRASRVLFSAVLDRAADQGRRSGLSVVQYQGRLIVNENNSRVDVRF